MTMTELSTDTVYAVPAVGAHVPMLKFHSFEDVRRANISAW